ncbi:polyisoprenoid-binding protein YceI [Mycobacterium frederiksbergense]|uniref:Polyisoprenoid-binding protein YceI n=1 Tax=Mycolicibacterium frederiksbergense TaxID=117567 RepID=A0ABT6KYF9_9MYCO|nr:YceI family protein [Mycolicibacterium frederiksbergense]MDH6195735.1 polyisoprenoid-binding protein YceI [Mycolicibacterium frederiksbergense]
MRQSSLGPESGELLIRTGITGTAARMGHRLTIAMRSWRATVDWDGDEPTGVEVTVELDSLEVLRGEGGMTPLSGPEKALVRTNALKTLRAKRFPQATFRSTSMEHDADSVRLPGTLDLNGRTADQTVDVRIEDAGDSWRISGRAQVRHSDFGIKQYSMLMGAMKVADEVEVTLSATLPRNPA